MRKAKKGFFRGEKLSRIVKNDRLFLSLTFKIINISDQSLNFFLFLFKLVLDVTKLMACFAIFIFVNEKYFFTRKAFAILNFQKDFAAKTFAFHLLNFSKGINIGKIDPKNAKHAKGPAHESFCLLSIPSKVSMEEIFKGNFLWGKKMGPALKI